MSSTPTAPLSTIPTPREHQILSTLNTTLSTLTSIDNVLSEILTLTDPEDPDSVYTKQEAVRKSLKKWEKMVVPKKKESPSSAPK
jgi:hypothetical protein